MKLNRGVNLGGYLSQCAHTRDHYRCFISEDDIRQIADWGLDHIRLPVDCEVLETEEGKRNTEGHGYVRQVISWCEKYGLNVVLDLHKAYGYAFINAFGRQKNILFESPELKQRFIRLWENIAREYGDCAVWTYKGMDFGLTDPHYADIRDELISLWTAG